MTSVFKNIFLILLLMQTKERSLDLQRTSSLFTPKALELLLFSSFVARSWCNYCADLQVYCWDRSCYFYHTHSSTEDLWELLMKQNSTSKGENGTLYMCNLALHLLFSQADHFPNIKHFCLKTHHFPRSWSCKFTCGALHPLPGGLGWMRSSTIRFSGRCLCPWQGVWNHRVYKVPSNQTDSVTLW